MTSGKTYVIDMESPQLDTLLRLEDEKGKVLVKNDNISPTNLSSRIFFTPREDGSYRVVATSFQQRGVGIYTIIVRRIRRPEKIAAGRWSLPKVRLAPFSRKGIRSSSQSQQVAGWSALRRGSGARRQRGSAGRTARRTAGVGAVTEAAPRQRTAGVGNSATAVTAPGRCNDECQGRLGDDGTA